ncbi:hypothetical protein [Streptomyces griseosporeus]
MSLMSTEPTAAQPGDSNSYNDGYTDGELAATTHLSSRRVHARASMADPYDPQYAQGLIDGYLHTIQVNAALAEKRQRR